MPGDGSNDEARMTNLERNPNAQTMKTEVSSFGFRHSFDIRHSTFGIRSMFHFIANRVAAFFMKVLFGYSSRVYVSGLENTERASGFLLASNHISHFDPFIISSVFRRKIDWMAMAEFFPLPLIGWFLRAVDAFPAARDRADRKTIRTAIERLKGGRIVGLFPEGGIRNGTRSLLEGAPLRAGAVALAQIAGTPILPCVIVGSDRLYSPRRWLPFRRTGIWIAFGEPIPTFVDLKKSEARDHVERELTSSFQRLYAELRQKFQLTADDLPQSPQERFAERPAPKQSEAPRRFGIKQLGAFSVDSMMCASMNLLQWRHRLHARSRDEMESYVARCETLTAGEFYAVPSNGRISDKIGNHGGTIAWPSPVETNFSANNVARADLFPCARGWQAPTVIMLHSLLSASRVGYSRWAARFNELGWNACFMHLPYHYSRVPRGYWNGELAITADLIRNAEGLRQGVIEVRQLIQALRERGCQELGILGTSYGAWIGALLALVESDLRFVALMAPIVNVEHAIWTNRATIFMRRELKRANVDPELTARHLHLSSPLHNHPLCQPDRILFVAGDFDRVVRLSDIEEIHRKWLGSDLLRVPQGHFGYRMMRDTVARLKERYL